MDKQIIIPFTEDEAWKFFKKNIHKAGAVFIKCEGETFRVISVGLLAFYGESNSSDRTFILFEDARDWEFNGVSVGRDYVKEKTGE